MAWWAACSKKWHRVTVTWMARNTSETNANNPFRNYRLNVAFAHPVSGKTYVVPGYFCADGDAANSSADSGNQWRVNFAAGRNRQVDFVASFRAGRTCSQCQFHGGSAQRF